MQGNDINDIPDQKRAAAALHQSEQRYRTLMEVTSDWIWEVDPNGRYTFSNRAVADVLGYPPEEVIGRTPFDFMPPAEAARIYRVFGAISAAMRPFSSLENTNLHRSGRRVVLETSGVPIFDEKGGFRGFRGIDRDVTAHKKLEKELKKARDGLEKKVKKAALEIEAKQTVLQQEIDTDISALKSAEKALRRREQQLREKTMRLQEMNTALEVLLRKREQDKTIIQKRIRINLRRLVAPYLDSLIDTRLSERQRFLVDTLKSNLSEVMSPFSERLSSALIDLTKTELEIANLVRLGKSTTQIAAALNISYKTAETHRWRIRKKLGLTHKKANLMSYLSRLQDPV